MTSPGKQTKLCLLGLPHIANPSSKEQFIHIRSQKALALLAYIVQKREAVSRLELATLLWPDKPETNGRNNLSGELKRLTSILPDSFENNYQSIYFKPAGQVEVDSWQLAENVVQTEAWPNLLTAAVEHLRDGPQLADFSRFSGLNAWVVDGGIDRLVAQANQIRGDFAAGLSLKNCHEFETWLINERDEIRRQVVKVLQFLGAYFALAGDAVSSRMFTARLLELEPWREDGHQLLMLLFARQGEYKRGIEQFALCEAGLMMTPSAATQKVYQLISTKKIRVWDNWQPRSLSPAATWPECPYFGLDAFTEADAELYFGRDRLISKLVKQIQTQQTVALVGASGSGKSSLMMAGVLPVLRKQTDWGIVTLRLGARPFHALVHRLEQVNAQVDASAHSAESTTEVEKEIAERLISGELLLPDYLAQVTDPDRDFLLIIDQFEELFTLGSHPDHQAKFVDMLFGAEDNGTDRSIQVRIFLTMRADFMGQALQHWPLVQAMRSSLELIGSLSNEELNQVIVAPAAQKGVLFEPGLVERILDDVSAEPEPLPLLEFALTALWQLESQQIAGNQLILRHESYESIGRVSGAITHHAKAVFDVLPDEQQADAHRVFLQLVQPGNNTVDTRRIAARGDFSDAEWQMARYLADNRLVVIGGDGGGSETAEVAHEALIGSWIQKQSWFNENRAFRLWQERLRQALYQWEIIRQDDGALLRGVFLAEAEEWLADEVQADYFSQQELRFIEASLAFRDARLAEAEAQRQRQLAQAQTLAEAEHKRAEIEVRTSKRLRWFAAGLALFFVVATAAAIGAFQQRQVAVQAAELSHSLNLASSAQLALRDGNTDLALALAIEANQTDNHPPQVDQILAESAYAPGTVHRFEAAEGSVNRALWSNDEQFVLSASDAGDISLLNSKTGEILNRYVAHTASVQDIIFSSDQKTFFSAGSDGAILEWELATGQMVREFSQGHQSQSGVNTLAIDPSDRWLLSGGDDHRLVLWDIGTGKVERRFEGHEGAVLSVAFDPTGEKILSGGADQLGLLWEIDSNSPIKTLAGHPDAVVQIEFMADGANALIAANDLTLWDLSDGSIVKEISISGAIFSFALDPAEKTVIIGSDVGNLQLRHLASGQNRQQLLGHKGAVHSMVLSQDGHRLLSADAAGEIRIWDTWNGSEVGRYEYDDLGGLLSLDISADESSALIGTVDGILLEQPLTRNGTPRFLPKSKDWLWGGTHILPDQKRAIFASGFRIDPPTGETLHMVDIESGESLDIGSYTAGVSRLAILPDGQQALFTSLDGSVWLWDLAGGKGGNQIMLEDPAPAMGVSIAPDGETAVVSFASGAIFHIALPSGEVLGRFSSSEAPVRALAHHPDGRSVFSGSFDQTIVQWDLSDYRMIQRFEGHQEFISQIRMLPAGDLMLSTSVDKTMILWDVADGSIVRHYQSFVGNPLDIRLSADGKRAFSVEDRDAAVLRIWRIDTTEGELQAWIENNRYVSEFSCEQRRFYNIQPLCPSD